MDAFYRGLGQFVVRFRFLILAAWLVVGGLCVVELPALASVVKTQQSDFLPANSASLRAQRLSLKFDLTSNTLAAFTLVASSSGSKLTPAQQADIIRMENTIRTLDQVRSVKDLGASPDGQARQAQIFEPIPSSPFSASQRLYGRTPAQPHPCKSLSPRIQRSDRLPVRFLRKASPPRC